MFTALLAGFVPNGSRNSFARGSETHNLEELPQSACVQLFSALHHEAMSSNPKLAPPTMKQMSAFIGLVDIDRSKSVTFSEMVLAVGRTAEDPLLASSIGFQLNDVRAVR